MLIITSDTQMSLRRFFGLSEGELMRSDAKPCSRLTRHTAGIFSVGGGLAFWILCRMHYGQFPITVSTSHDNDGVVFISYVGCEY